MAIFSRIFLEHDRNKNWIADPFNADVSGIKGLTKVQENQLIEISCDLALKHNFKEISLSKFWVNLKKVYKQISEEAVKHLLLTLSTYHTTVKRSSTLVGIHQKQIQKQITIIGNRFKITTK